MPTAVAPMFDWSDSAAGRVLVSRRLGTVAPHLFTSKPLAFRDRVAEDFDAVGQSLGTSGLAVVRVRQVHGRAVVRVESGRPIEGTPEADAIVSTDPSRAISVR